MRLSENFPKALTLAALSAAFAAQAQEATQMTNVVIEARGPEGKLALAPITLAFGRAGGPQVNKDERSIFIPANRGVTFRLNFTDQALGSLFLKATLPQLTKDGAQIRFGYELETHGEGLYRRRFPDFNPPEPMRLDGIGAVLVDAPGGMIVMKDVLLRNGRWPEAEESPTTLPLDGTPVTIAQGQGFSIKARWQPPAP